MRATFDVSFSEEGYRAATDMGRTEMKWSAFTHWQETAEMFLLFQLPGGALSVPKRFFQTREDVEAVRQLLSSQVGPLR